MSKFQCNTCRHRGVGIIDMGPMAEATVFLCRAQPTKTEMTKTGPKNRYPYVEHVNKNNDCRLSNELGLVRRVLRRVGLG